MLPRLALLGVDLPSYPVLFTCGVAAGVALTYERARRVGLAAGSTLAPAAAAVVFGLFAAYIWSLAFESLPLIVASGREPGIADLGGGGLSVVGGLLGGALGAWLVLRSRAGGFLAWCDLAAPGAALAIGVARFGCLAAGCCHGAPTLFPIAIVYEDWRSAARPIGVPLHATQIYEAVGCFVLAAVIARSPRHRGLPLTLLVAGYGLLRLCVETLRADHRGFIGAAPPTTWAALFAFLVGAAVLATRRWAESDPRTPPDLHRTGLAAPGGSAGRATGGER